MKRNIILFRPPVHVRRFFLLFVLLLSFSIAPVIQSQAQIRWIATGAAPKYWSDPANWSGGVVPAASANVLFDATGTTVCTLTADVTVDRLTIDGFTSAIDLNGFDLQIAGTTGGVSLMTGSVISSAPSSELRIGTTLSPVVGITEFGGTTVGSATQSVNVICYTQRVRIGSFLSSRGSSFYGSVMIEKTAVTFDACFGSCIFYDDLRLVLRSSVGGLNTQGRNEYYGAVDIENNGVGSVSLDDDVYSVYHADVSLRCTGGGSIFIGRALSGTSGTPTLLRGDVSVSTSSSTGVFFGSSTGYVILESGRSITTSSFNSNELSFQNFTQVGSTPQSFTLGGDAYVRFNSGTVFNGATTVTAPGVMLNGATFNSSVSLTFTGGSGATSSTGGNTFNAAARLRITGGTWTLGATAATIDRFNSSLTIERTAGTIQPASRNTIVINGDLVVESATNVSFGSSGTVSPRIVQFTGTTDQRINCVGTGIPVFRNLSIDKPSGVINLEGSFTVSGSLNFIRGIVVAASASNKVNFNHGASCSGASDVSHVDGVVRKTGSQTFSFPTGDGGVFKPIELATAPATTTDAFEAQYFLGTTPHPRTFSSPLKFVNGLEYWTLNHVIGTSAVSIAVPWDISDTPGLIIGDVNDLVVAISSGTSWSSYAGTATGTTSAGKITLNSPLSSFGSYITLGSASFDSPLPIKLDFFRGAVENDHRVQLHWQTSEEINADVFVIQKAINSLSFVSVDTIEAYGNSMSERQYTWKDSDPLRGTGYYRLLQLDKNGDSEIFEAIALVNDFDAFHFWPNPARRRDVLTFSDRVNVRIFDQTGGLMSINNSVTWLPLEELKPGIYFMAIEGRGVYKLLIVH